MGERAATQLTDERLAAVSALDEVARRSGHGVLDLAVAWLLTRPAVSSVIAGATRPEQIVANVEAGKWRVDDAVLAEVDALAPGPPEGRV
jgi:aryl-alcohol dehydrogenase-like predicted oxidoreductase